MLKGLSTVQILMTQPLLILLQCPMFFLNYILLVGVMTRGMGMFLCPLHAMCTFFLPWAVYIFSLLGLSTRSACDSLGIIRS